MATRTLTLRGIPDHVLEPLRARAEANRRSLNSELLVILERAAAAEAPSEEGVPSPGGRRPRPGTLREQPAATYADAGSAPDPLDAVDREGLATVCRSHDIRWLAVFGSFAEGRARPDSDADVVVEFEPGRTPGFGIVRVARALAPLFGGRQVDLVTRRELGRLTDSIMGSARTLYGA